MKLWKKYKNTVFGTLAFLFFFMMYGTVGAMECETVSLGIGTVRSFAYMGAWVFFTWLAGGFEEYEYPEERRSANEVQASFPDTRPGRTSRQGADNVRRKVYYDQ